MDVWGSIQWGFPSIKEDPTITAIRGWIDGMWIRIMSNMHIKTFTIKLEIMLSHTKWFLTAIIVILRYRTITALQINLISMDMIITVINYQQPDLISQIILLKTRLPTIWIHKMGNFPGPNQSGNGLVLEANDLTSVNHGQCRKS